jgi:hypothetical protein
MLASLCRLALPAPGCRGNWLEREGTINAQAQGNGRLTREWGELNT